MGILSLRKDSRDKPSQPGLSMQVFVCKISDFEIDGHPQPPATGTEEAKRTVVTAPTFKAVGLGFACLEVTAESGDWKPSIETKGDSVMYKNTLEFFVGGTDKKLAVWLDSVMGVDLVMIWKDKCGGYTYVAGCPCSPVKFTKAEGNTKDERGYKITVEFFDKPNYYEVPTGIPQLP